MRNRTAWGLFLGTVVLTACAGSGPEARSPSTNAKAPEPEAAYPSPRPAQPGYPQAAASSPAGYPQAAMMESSTSMAPASPVAAPSAYPPPPAPPSGAVSRATSSMPILAPQGGSVKAGEWDDNANYREFQKYLGLEANVGFHPVDVSDRKFIVVRDAQGKAVPRCRVNVVDGRQKSVTLTTTASGHAVLFPHAEGLTGNELSAIAQCQGQTVRGAVPVEVDGIADLKLPVARALPATRTVDVAFILDTTGSMSEEIAAVKSTIEKVASSLEQGQNSVRVRIGMVDFKDRGDEYVTKVHPMTTDIRGFAQKVANIRASGGGDTPESVNAGVHVALNQLDWNDDAVVKVAFLIGDAPPHLDYPNDADYAVDMKDAAHRGIQLFTIAASGMDDLGQVVFRQMAQYTGATNLFVLRGGAGAQSAGAGDPKSSCGGTQTAYASGNLDGLVLAKIRGELKALDRDPLKIAGIKKDEQAKPCEDRVLMLD